MAVEEEQEPVCDENGQPLEDDDGNYFFAELGWHVIRDQFGMVCWDSERQLCWEEVDEDELVLQTKSARKQASESLLVQNQRLQGELEQAQFTHQSDVERARELIARTEAQNQAEFREMMDELEKKKTEFAKEQRLEVERYEEALRMERVRSAQQKAANDQKWAACVQQRQVAQAEKQKEAADESACRIAELE